METSASAPLPRFERIEFVGSGGEYFRIWIVNLLLTIITLGSIPPGPRSAGNSTSTAARAWRAMRSAITPPAARYSGDA